MAKSRHSVSQHIAGCARVLGFGWIRGTGAHRPFIVSFKKFQNGLDAPTLDRRVQQDRLRDDGGLRQIVLGSVEGGGGSQVEMVVIVDVPGVVAVPIQASVT